MCVTNVPKKRNIKTKIINEKKANAWHAISLDAAKKVHTDFMADYFVEDGFHSEWVNCGAVREKLMQTRRNKIVGLDLISQFSFYFYQRNVNKTLCKVNSCNQTKTYKCNLRMKLTIIGTNI